MAWTLCSKEDVMDLHPISEPDLKDSWSEMVEGLIRDHMGALYLGTTSVISSEYHNGDGTDTLVVNKPPIVSVQSLYVNGASYTASYYIVFENRIQLIEGVNFPVGRGNVVISYTSGSATVDDQIRLTAAVMIVAIINFKGRQGADGSLKYAQASQREGEPTPVRSVGLINHLKAIMKESLKREKVMIF